MNDWPVPLDKILTVVQLMDGGYEQDQPRRRALLQCSASDEVVQRLGQVTTNSRKETIPIPL